VRFSGRAWVDLGRGSVKKEEEDKEGEAKAKPRGNDIAGEFWRARFY